MSAWWWWGVGWFVAGILVAVALHLFNEFGERRWQARIAPERVLVHASWTCPHGLFSLDTCTECGRYVKGASSCAYLSSEVKPPAPISGQMCT